MGTLNDLFAQAEADARAAADRQDAIDATPAGRARIAALRARHEAERERAEAQAPETTCGLCGEDLSDEGLCPECDDEGDE